MGKYTEIKTAVPMNGKVIALHNPSYKINEDGSMSIIYDTRSGKVKNVLMSGLSGVCSRFDITVDCDDAARMVNKGDYLWLIPVVSNNGHRFFIVVSEDKPLVICDNEISKDAVKVIGVTEENGLE